MKIVAEDKLVEGKTQDLLAEWERDKPVEVRTLKENTKIPTNSNLLYVEYFFVVVQGNLKPEDATNALKMFEGKLQRLKEERDNVVKAKEALELAEPGNYFVLFKDFL